MIIFSRMIESGGPFKLSIVEFIEIYRFCFLFFNALLKDDEKTQYHNISLFENIMFFLPEKQRDSNKTRVQLFMMHRKQLYMHTNMLVCGLRWMQIFITIVVWRALCVCSFYFVSEVSSNLWVNPHIFFYIFMLSKNKNDINTNSIRNTLRRIRILKRFKGRINY